MTIATIFMLALMFHVFGVLVLEVRRCCRCGQWRRGYCHPWSIRIQLFVVVVFPCMWDLWRVDPPGWCCTRLPGLGPIYGVLVCVVLVICVPGWFEDRWCLLCRLTCPPYWGVWWVIVVPIMCLIGVFIELWSRWPVFGTGPFILWAAGLRQCPIRVGVGV